VLLWLRSDRGRQVSKLSAGGLMLALWLVTSVVAASPQLHQLLHKDAQSPQHYCLFNQLSQHSVAASSGFILAPKPPPSAGDRLVLNDFALLPSFDFVLSDGRAPPFNSSLTAAVG
jgi:hypothetical protein